MNLQCPIKLNDYPTILLAHGGGGKLMTHLINDMFRSVFKNVQDHDGARLVNEGNDIVMTTDSFVVKPLFFPGGDIGKLCIAGTVNDLAMCGAEPKYISLGLIIEEGLEMEILWEIVQSIAKEAQFAGVSIVTGDTKVVERGKGDGIYINTTGIGWIKNGVNIAPNLISPNDAIIISGDIGRHGIAVMSYREGLEFETDIQSDCASLHEVVASVLEMGIPIHCLRDLTRGGLAAALVELSNSCNLEMNVQESRIPIEMQVMGVCELLGIDPISVACEGRFILFTPQEYSDDVIARLQQHPFANNAIQIGSVSENKRNRVILNTLLGTDRLLELPSGEQLPRIC